MPTARIMAVEPTAVLKAAISEASGKELDTNLSKFLLNLLHLMVHGLLLSVSNFFAIYNYYLY